MGTASWCRARFELGQSRSLHGAPQVFHDFAQLIDLILHPFHLLPHFANLRRQFGSGMQLTLHPLGLLVKLTSLIVQPRRRQVFGRHPQVMNPPTDRLVLRVMRRVVVVVMGVLFSMLGVPMLLVATCVFGMFLVRCGVFIVPAGVPRNLGKPKSVHGFELGSQRTQFFPRVLGLFLPICEFVFPNLSVQLFDTSFQGGRLLRDGGQLFDLGHHPQGLGGFGRQAPGFLLLTRLREFHRLTLHLGRSSSQVVDRPFGFVGRRLDGNQKQCHNSSHDRPAGFGRHARNLRVLTRERI
jgi:hypothetical protein